MGALCLCPANLLAPITFNAEGLVIVREALDYGIAAVADRVSDSSIAWDDAFIGECGDLTVLAYVKEIYDATIVLALAAQTAVSTDGPAIRDRLRAVTSGSGEMSLLQLALIMRWGRCAMPLDLC